MNDYTNIKKYCELMLKRENTSDHMYESIGDMMDKIWYNFNPTELGLATELFDMAQGNTTETRLIDILQTIKEETTMNTNNNVFETKEEYKALLAFWKAFHAEGKHKPTKVEYRNSKPFNNGYFDGEIGYHMESALTFKHHLIFLAATGRDLSKAFADTTTRQTYAELREWMNWNTTMPFHLFGDAIDSKYHSAILDRINAYLKQVG